MPEYEQKLLLLVSKNCVSTPNIIFQFKYNKEEIAHLLVTMNEENSLEYQNEILKYENCTGEIDFFFTQILANDTLLDLLDTKTLIHFIGTETDMRCVSNDDQDFVDKLIIVSKIIKKAIIKYDDKALILYRCCAPPFLFKNVTKEVLNEEYLFFLNLISGEQMLVYKNFIRKFVWAIIKNTNNNNIISKILHNTAPHTIFADVMKIIKITTNAQDRKVITESINDLYLRLINAEFISVKTDLKYNNLAKDLQFIDIIKFIEYNIINTPLTESLPLMQKMPPWCCNKFLDCLIRKLIKQSIELNNDTANLIKITVSKFYKNYSKLITDYPNKYIRININNIIELVNYGVILDTEILSKIILENKKFLNILIRCEYSDLYNVLTHIMIPENFITKKIQAKKFNCYTCFVLCVYEKIKKQIKKLQFISPKVLSRSQIIIFIRELEPKIVYDKLKKHNTGSKHPKDYDCDKKFGKTLDSHYKLLDMFMVNDNEQK